MTYTVSDYRSFLLDVAPFDQLPPEVVTKLADTFQPWRYRMGQVILMRGKFSSYVSILLSGQARSLGYDPRTEMPVTLKLLQPGRF